ncbi:MAG: 2Fe-2S iron-sulfur cluster-binding protein [Bacteroidales bacterium]|nr:2Fe-2S iron-sulfur cluster-binding protein [Bacteroidales bacterium]
MKIKINTQELDAPEGEKLIEAARRNGIEIPSLCYAAGYQHQASCMVCVVKDCATGQIVPSCSTVVADGMAVDSESDEVKALRRQSLELLLSDHIAACRPPCKPEQCSLRKHALAYSAKWNRYPRYSAIKATQPQHIKDNFWFDVTKCIRCGLCVYNTSDGFTFKNRGFGMEVVLPEESVKNVDESLCEVCPTQALFLAKL